MEQEQHKPGTVYLVGAGPGDPGLATVRALELLREAEVVIYDHLANAVLLREAGPGAETIYVGKIAGEHPVPQDRINVLLIEKAREGGTVVRLKGGDPFVFGRGGEEALALKAAGIPFEVVPGVTAGIAALACAGIPATHRGLATSVSLITGHEDPAKPASELDWKAIAAMHGTLVFYMGVNNLEKIAGRLRQCGKPGSTPVAVVRRGTLPRQQTITGTLDGIAEKASAVALKPPALIVVGAVAALRDDLSWFETRPLFGRRIVVTRSRDQAGELVGMLERQGADVTPFPTIKIMAPESYRELDDAIRNVSRYAWIIFTSVNGVQAFFGRLACLGRDARAMSGVRVCAIGPATAARLRDFGIIRDLRPRQYVAESIIEAFGEIDISGQYLLLPRADIARPRLREGLEALGAHVHEVAAYRTVSDADHPDDVLALVRAGEFDLAAFTSSSTVRNFVACVGPEKLPKIFRRAGAACIGPVTRDTARGFGIPCAAVAESFTMQGLVDAIVRYCESLDISAPS